MATRIDHESSAALDHVAPAGRYVPRRAPSEERTSLFGLARYEPLVDLSSQPSWNPPAQRAALDPWAGIGYRCFDNVIAIVCLLALAPFMLMIALLIWLGDRGPIFYSQPRFGRHGKVFGCLKFRTMRVGAERLLAELLATSPAISELWERDRKLPHDPRITACGRFLRRFSIDELPQLFNVLKGEMSIVGPRPLATDETVIYGEAFADYCLLKPGITGPWQISGRNKISFAGRALLDREYARTKCLRRDCEIILRTIPVVLRGTGY
jgi:exopolysaccharide production protein ExoY